MKKTVKYCQALRTIPNLKNTNDMQAVYDQMQRAGFSWDSGAEQWVDLSNEPADQPTDLLRIRVWADAKVVEQIADEVVLGLNRYFALEDRSGAYPCRPPKQLESRIYLTFRILGTW